MEQNRKLKLLSPDLVKSVTSFQNNSNSKLDDLGTISVTRGHGKIVKAGVWVSEGVTAKLEVEINVTTISSTSFNENVHKITEQLSVEQKKQLEETTSNGRTGWLLSLLGIGASGNYKKFVQEQNFSTTITDKTVSEAVKNMFTQENQQSKVSGKFKIKGVGPRTEAELFVEMMVIETEDKRHRLQVINDQAIAASTSGSTKEVQLDSPKVLTIMPLS